MVSQTKARILLVDDDRHLQKTVSDFLSFEGYKVTSALSGEEALEKLATANPDLIILDINMPGMGGIGFLNEISSGGKPSHPVLVLTTRGNMAEFFKDLDVDGFIAKPCEPTALLDKIAGILAKTTPQSTKATQTVGGAVIVSQIIIGEDDPNMAKVLTREFTAAGFKVTACKDGQQVLESAISNPPAAVVAKSMLTMMNGKAVARMLKEIPKTAKVPVILYDDISGQSIETVGSLSTRDGSSLRSTHAANMAVELVAKVNAALA